MKWCLDCQVKKKNQISLIFLADKTDVKMEQDKDTVLTGTHWCLKKQHAPVTGQMDAVQLVASHAGALSPEWRSEAGGTTLL